jgi:DNA-binding FrmR family transcriptional regulator
MVEPDRQCREVVQQISAAGRAPDQTGLKSSPWELRHCLQDEQAAEQAGYSQAELEDVFAVLMCPRCLADRARGRGPYPS